MSLARLRSELEARHALKAWEIEENLDRIVFRPVAMGLVAIAAPLGITANQVSVLGMLITIAVGPLLFGPGLPRLLAAVALLWIAETLDAVDGQLARLAQRPSRFGRIVDGLCNTIGHLTLYAFVGVGLWLRTGHVIWLALAYLAALSHSLQASLYDFYRQEYIRIVHGRGAADADAPEELDAALRAGDSRQWGRRVLVLLFRHYAQRQTLCTPTYQPLRRAIATRWGGGLVLEEYSRIYARLQRPMVKWWNCLGSNTHLIVFSIALLVSRPVWYLWANLVALNLVALALTWRQGRVARRLLAALPAAAAAPSALIDPAAGDHDAVLFDFGGTLDGDGVHWSRRFDAAFRALGLDFPATDLDAAFAGSERRMRADPDAARLDLEASIRRQTALVLAALGYFVPDVAEAAAASLLAETRATLQRNAAVLRALRGRTRIGVLSNFNGNLELVLREEGLAAFCDGIFDSAVVGLRKPDPAFFRHALAALGASAPRSLMVGDSVEMDLRPARAIGMQTVWVDGGAPPPADFRPDRVVRSVRDLLVVAAAAAEVRP